MERTNVIRSKGQPRTLLGPELEVDRPAPEFRVVNAQLAPVTLQDTVGHVSLFSVAPSIDTNICAIQMKTFDARAHQLSGDIRIYGVSMDLPYAQSRFVESNRIDRIIMLSDYQDRSFGENWGLLIKETRLLARAVIITDRNSLVRYVQIVPDTSHEPDYEEALRAIKDVVGG